MYVCYVFCKMNGHCKTYICKVDGLKVIVYVSLWIYISHDYGKYAILSIKITF